jgi:hypothetical protein
MRFQILLWYPRLVLSILHGIKEVLQIWYVTWVAADYIFRLESPLSVAQHLLSIPDKKHTSPVNACPVLVALWTDIENV